MAQRYEAAYSYLYGQIVNYKIKPGMSIIEADVANTLNISRTPVREALNRLVSDGLVCKEEGRGFFAANVSDKDVKNISVLRRSLELTALSEGFDKFDREKLCELRTRIQELDEKNWSSDYYDVDQELHEYIVNNSENQWLIKFHKTLSALVDRFRRIADYNQGRPSKTKQEHLDFLNAVIDGDFEKAYAYLDYHLRNVEMNIEEVYSRFFM